MLDLILTILGVLLYFPFIVYAIQIPWSKTSWTRQLLSALLVLQVITLLHIPSVMYCCAVLLFAALVIHLFLVRPAFRWTPVLVCSGLYMAWFVVSLLWSPAPLKGLRFIDSHGLPLIGFAVLGAVMCIEEKEYERMIKTCLQSAFIFVGLGISAWLMTCLQLEVHPWEWPTLGKTTFYGEYVYQWIFRFNGGVHGYTHPSYNLLPFFAILCLAMPLRKRGMLPAWKWWVLWVGGLLLSILAQSRMSIFYSTLMPALYALYMTKTTKQRLTAAACVAAIGVVCIGFTASYGCHYADDINREQIKTLSWKYVHAKPLTGAGVGALSPEEISRVTGETSWPEVGHLPHNEWLADWTHAGILAALLSLALYAAAGIESVRKRRWEISAWLLLFCIFSCLEPPLYIGKGLYIFCLMATVLYMRKVNR